MTNLLSTRSPLAGTGAAATALAFAPPSRAHSIALLLAKELRDAWRNRWFLLYAAAFTVLACGIAWLSVSGIARSGYASLGRTAGSLISLVLLVVPLMGLTLGAQAIAAERERGALLYLLAQPVDVLEVVLAKFLGLITAVATAVLFGFAVAAMAMSGQASAGQLAGFLRFLVLSLLLATATVSLGLLLSALAGRAAVAAGLALFAWLALVLGGDLGVMGTALALRLDADAVLALALINPLQVFKVAAVLALRGGLDALGPAGLYATTRWGDAVAPALLAILVLWTALPLLATGWLMRRRLGES
jgi:Cu-processing system permease protein